MSLGEAYIIGSLLNNRYEIIKRLGKGKNSRVYLAQDKNMDHALRAIKQMAVEYIDYDQYLKAMQDFNREAELLSTIEHPSIPSLYDYFLSAGYYFLVMQYIHGKTLEQVLTSAPGGRLSEVIVTDWCIQLCDTLNYIHTLDPPMVYRDMKPSNVIFDDKLKRIFLIDFGVARFIHTKVSNVTAIGTLGYAPPELYHGIVEPASDIYSLGATMFHLLTGLVPDFPMPNSASMSMHAPRKVNNKISPAMDKIVKKAMALKPEKRFASARDMQHALENHLAQLKGDASLGLDIHTTLDYPPNEWASRKKKSAPAPGCRLKVHRKMKLIAEFCINNSPFMIGRLDLAKGIVPDLDLTDIDKSGKISRKHGQIVKVFNNYYFEDLDSSNGSWLNGEKLIAKKRKLLRSGDHITLGELTLEFLFERF